MSTSAKLKALQEMTDADVEAYLDRLELYNASNPPGRLLSSEDRELVRGLITRWREYARKQETVRALTGNDGAEASVL